MDQFLVLNIPTDINFDLVAICGPGWPEGDYSISIKVQIDDGEVQEFGTTQIKIPGEDFVYNAYAPNMKVSVKEEAKYVKFFVYRNEELVLERKYKVAPIFIPQETASQETVS